jgi:hypothetical protein
MQQLGDHDTVFPLHEDCLQISRRAIKHLIPTTLGSRPSASCLSILNSILQSRFRDNARSAKPSDLVARNDLFDLCTATDLNGPRSVVGLSLLEWWASDYEVHDRVFIIVHKLTCGRNFTQIQQTCRTSVPAFFTYSMTPAPLTLAHRRVRCLPKN